ncbi:hypothetical protein Aph02nite_66280 [Actinoplanes philippinensis]|uniref:Serine aminopeptidase S33 domain-containing protein n=1 Tax=Actinoplanes philippinensis TaxID=35752 RepID=A0A1I2L2L4_9ACTN|nr:alpha/beta hydrolase [Actinoplanes philippinensis]GIE80678.1 hypothetical protein Aph02nite_66280 [Actinoplanes philippinensis]SFF72750.1 hypothetical protein SAMN05421541_119116 [Actinoplanes philippinensis]
MLTHITFDADGLTLAGDLRVAGDGAPAVVLTGPFTGVKEQVTGVYAARLHERGITTLAFDHRGFGQSGGRRAHEDSQGKLADLRAAVGVLAAHPAVDADRIGVVGICLGGGYAVRAAAADPRLRAVAGIAGAYNSPARFAAGDPEGYRRALASFIERWDEELPAVAPGGAPAAMGGDEPYEYYGTDRSRAEHWENRVTHGSLHALMTFDALGAAPLLSATPLLVVHGRKDDYCSPELAEALHEQATGPKRLHWLDAGRHIDLYDAEPYVTQAADETAAFLRSVLHDR